MYTREQFIDKIQKLMWVLIDLMNRKVVNIKTKKFFKRLKTILTSINLILKYYHIFSVFDSGEIKKTFPYVFRIF